MKVAVLFTLFCLLGSSFAAIVPASALIGCLTTDTCTLGDSFFGGFSANSDIEFNADSFLGLNLGAKVFVLTGTRSVGSILIDANNAARFVVQGTVTATSNTAQAALLVGSSAVVNVTGTLIVKGNAVIDGALNAAASSSVQVSGNMTTSSSSSSTSSSNSVYVDTSASIQVAGYVDLNALIVVAANGIFRAASDFTARANATVTGTIVAANYYQTQATLRVQTTAQNVAGAVNATTVRIQNAAYFAGNGYVNGNLNIEGSATVAVGNSPGTAYVRGDYRMSSTSTYQCDVASDSNYDRLIITGTAYLNGIAVIRLENNYQPNGRQVYNTLTHNQVSGTFNIVRGNTISDAADYSASYGGTQTALVHNSAVAVVFSTTLIMLSLIVSMM